MLFSRPIGRNLRSDTGLGADDVVAVVRANEDGVILFDLKVAQIERVFRGLKDGDWLGWGPMHHWTDSKIRIHAFYCMLGISLLQYLHRESQKVWPGLSVDQFLEELRQIQQFVLLYPPLGDKGPNRVATVLSKQSLAQQALAESLGLEQLCSTQRG